MHNEERGTLLDSVLAVGLGAKSRVERDIEINDSGYVIQIDTGGTVKPTGVTIELLGSINGSTFAILATHAMTASEITAGVAMFSVIGYDVDWIRANLTALVGGTAPTVKVIYKVG